MALHWASSTEYLLPLQAGIVYQVEPDKPIDTLWLLVTVLHHGTALGWFNMLEDTWVPLIIIDRLIDLIIDLILIDFC